MNYLSEIDDMWTNLKDEGDDVFYTESRKKLDEWFGENSFMAWLYEKYHDDSVAVDEYELKDYLKNILSDEQNYPDM